MGEELFSCGGCHYLTDILDDLFSLFPLGNITAYAAKTLEITRRCEYGDATGFDGHLVAIFMQVDVLELVESCASPAIDTP